MVRNEFPGVAGAARFAQIMGEHRPDLAFGWASPEMAEDQVRRHTEHDMPRPSSSDDRHVCWLSSDSIACTSSWHVQCWLHSMHELLAFGWASPEIAEDQVRRHTDHDMPRPSTSDDRHVRLCKCQVSQSQVPTRIVTGVLPAKQGLRTHAHKTVLSSCCSLCSRASGAWQLARASSAEVCTEELEPTKAASSSWRTSASTPKLLVPSGKWMSISTSHKGSSSSSPSPSGSCIAPRAWLGCTDSRSRCAAACLVHALRPEPSHSSWSHPVWRPQARSVITGKAWRGLWHGVSDRQLLCAGSGQLDADQRHRAAVHPAPGQRACDSALVRSLPRRCWHCATGKSAVFWAFFWASCAICK